MTEPRTEPRTDPRTDPPFAPDDLRRADPVPEIGRYVPLYSLGEGPTGLVYVAYDPELDRKVRLKLLAPGRGASSEQLLAEAKRLAQLSHPNIVAVHDVGEHGDVVFIATEFVRGTPLRRWLASPRTWHELLPPMLQVGRALAAAHAIGLVHGEFTPDSVVIGADGRPRVIDFGSGGGAAEPSQARRSDPPDAAADQLAFCRVLHAALGASRQAPARLKRVLERGLQADPRERWPSMEALVDALDRDPRRWRRALIACAGVAALIGGIVGVRRLEHERRVAACEAYAAAISADWNDAMRAEVAAGMRGTGAAYAETSITQTSRWLDLQAAAWSQAARESCMHLEAAQQPLAAACLDERRAEFADLVSMLRRPSAAQLLLAVNAVTALSPPDTCMEATWLLRQASDGANSEAAALRAALTRAGVARSLARYDEAIADARDVERQAEAAGLRELVVRARLVLGGVQLDRDELGPAAATLEDAFYEAGALGLDGLAFRAATDLTFLVGVRMSRPEAGLAWARFAEMMRMRNELAPDELGRAQMLHNRGQVLGQRGDLQAGIADLEEALAIRERLLGPEHAQVAGALKTLAILLRLLGRNEASLALEQRALAMSERIFGREHPFVAGLLINIGGNLTDQGDHQPARVAFEQALALQERIFGPDHRRVAGPLGNLAVAETNTGDYARARVHARRALELLERTLRPDHPDLAIILHLIVRLHMIAGEFAEARAAARRALEIQERAVGTEAPNYALALVQLGHVEVEAGEVEAGEVALEHARRIIEAKLAPEHAHYAEALTFLGEARLLRGDLAGALEVLTRALELRERNKTDAVDRAYTRFALARARLAAGRGTPDEIRAQARQAIRELQRFGPGGDLLRAKIEDWLAGSAAPGGADLRPPG